MEQPETGESNRFSDVRRVLRLRSCSQIPGSRRSHLLSQTSPPAGPLLHSHSGDFSKSRLSGVKSAGSYLFLTASSASCLTSPAPSSHPTHLSTHPPGERPVSSLTCRVSDGLCAFERRGANVEDFEGRKACSIFFSILPTYPCNVWGLEVI